METKSDVSEDRYISSGDISHINWGKLTLVKSNDYHYQEDQDEEPLAPSTAKESAQLNAGNDPGDESRGIDMVGASCQIENKRYRTTVKEKVPLNVYTLKSEVFTIGRANNCDLVIHNNKLISGKHCVIRRENDNTIWLEDTSTNGTLVNRKKKLHRDRCLIKHNDMIYLVYKNDVPAENVAYRFEMIDGEDDEIEEYATDQTLSDEIETPEKATQIVSGKRKSISPVPESSVTRKKIILDVDEPDVKDNDSDSAAAADTDDDDEIGETLLCIICQEIFHDCVSLQPCMHSFCAGCYSEWMEESKECPCCRLQVDRISKNHLVNNLVESYLKKNPKKKRSLSDLKALEDKNKITHDMLYKKQSEDSQTSSQYSDEPVSPLPNLTATPLLTTFINYNPHFARLVPTLGPPVTVCRQCPQNGGVERTACCGNTDINDAAANTASNEPVAGTSNNQNNVPKDVKSNPQAPAYVCRPGQSHILCMCCLQPMPDRRGDRLRDVTVPNQQCSICFRFYCHAYWTCPKADCLGCLDKFENMNFGRKCLTFIVLDNPFESNILKDYLDTKNLCVKEVLTDCIANMESGKYSSVDSTRGALTRETIICYPCGLRNFKELIYKYRCDIANQDLPAVIRNRTNCYWGKGCRTQKHKPHHAAKFNHICEASRTDN